MPEPYDPRRRREFITLIGGAAAWPLSVPAQQLERARRIGVLIADAGDNPEAEGRIASFQQTLERLGWKLGRNLHIQYRWGVNTAEHAQAAAAELLMLTPDVILTSGTPATAALHRLTTTVPIVFTIVSEPVAQGFVQSLSHPGGNITGFTNLEPTVAAKWLELLKEIAPGVTRIAIVVNPRSFPFVTQFSRSAEAIAEKLRWKRTRSQSMSPPISKEFLRRLGLSRAVA